MAIEDFIIRDGTPAPRGGNFMAGHAFAAIFGEYAAGAIQPANALAAFERHLNVTLETKEQDDLNQVRNEIDAQTTLERKFNVVNKYYRVIELAAMDILYTDRASMRARLAWRTRT